MMSAGDVPTSLGRYLIEEEIGRGMMGVVYRAKDPALGRIVALKAVRLAFAVPQEQRDGYEKRFMAEARVAAVLSHPGIVVVHDVGRDSETGTLFIALEYLQGETLAELLGKEGPMSPDRALRLVAVLAQALHHAHTHGVVHRDIKPANVMLLPSGQPKIMDFGIAKIPASDLTAAGEFFGTPSYMSPEQASGQTVDARSDLFSLGTVLYVLLTGKKPFDAPTLPGIFNAVLNKEPPAPSTVLTDLPEGVDRIVAKALAKDPAMRYASGLAMADDIQALLGGTPSPTPPPLRVVPVAAPPPHRPKKTSAGLWLAMGAVMVLFLAAGAAALFFLRSYRASAGAPAGSTTGHALPTLPPFELPTLAPSTSHLEVSFEYSFRTGRIQIFSDDDPILDEALEGRLVKKVLNVRFHKGNFEKTVDLAPGEHVLRVQVEADGESQVRRIRTKFQGGATRHLVVSLGGVNLGGLLKKDLTVEWAG